MSAAASVPGFVPDWPASGVVRALVSTRAGGVSSGAYGLEGGTPGGLNLGDHVGDDPGAVMENRSRLQAALPGPVRWLQQVHGVAVHDGDEAWAGDVPPVADAAVTTRAGTVLAVMTADCLPILFADASGRAVGVAHAGWRGLAAGVAEAAVDAMRARLGDDARLFAWLGPAIGPDAFEVGDEVRQAFCDLDAGAGVAFRPGPVAGKWWADLYTLARRRLASRGVHEVTGGGLCTVADPTRFYSHRRDRRSGRFASLVWLAG
jgi:YfiH family protein